MANKRTLGKIRKNVQGFDIREIVKTKSANDKIPLSTGMVGLYRGKKIIGEFKANEKGIAEATCNAITLAENSRKERKAKNDYLRRTTPSRAKHTTKKEAGKKAYLERIGKA